jgi:hypothetical protein
MASANRIFLRQHVEAVWNVRLPPIEQGEVTLLPESASQPWKLYAAELADGRVYIWQPGIERAERETLLTRLKEAQLLPANSTPPPGISREVVFQLTAEPVIDLATAWQVAQPLTSEDYALVEAFEPGEAAYYFQPERRPLVGVVVDGRLLSVAHSSRRTTEACELGIDTLAEARRRGYALAATIVWSAAIVREGLTPIYSALAANTASLNLAVAAGYREFARATTVE